MTLWHPYESIAECWKYWMKKWSEVRYFLVTLQSHRFEVLNTKSFSWQIFFIQQYYHILPVRFPVLQNMYIVFVHTDTTTHSQCPIQCLHSVESQNCFLMTLHLKKHSFMLCRSACVNKCLCNLQQLQENCIKWKATIFSEKESGLNWCQLQL